MSITFTQCLSYVIKTFGSGSIFYVVASVACILIGKDDEKSLNKLYLHFFCKGLFAISDNSVF